MKRKLYRDRKRARLGGVCAGLAEYLDFDVTIVRLIWIILAFAGSVGFWLYLTCWLILPEKRQVQTVVRQEDLVAEISQAKDAGFQS